MRLPTSAGALALAVATLLLSLPAGASASAPDLQILSVDVAPTSVPVGIPTRVSYTLLVRDNGDATTGPSTAIGPVGGLPVFKTKDLRAQNGESCDAPGPDARCHVTFDSRLQTQSVIVTDTVLATAEGTITRTFAADVVAPDTVATSANDTASVTLQAVPGALPTVSKVSIRPASSLTAAQRRRRAVGKILFTLDRQADVTVTVERKSASGKYKLWGEFLREERRQGANSLVLPYKIGKRNTSPINFTLHHMAAGSYRITLVADDGEHTSKPVRRRFVVPRRR